LYSPGVHGERWQSLPGLPAAPPALPTVARVVPRIAAWLLDTVIMFAASIAVLLAGGLYGAWSLNPQFMSDSAANPNLTPSVPVLQISRPEVLATSLAIAVGIVVYAMVCWARFGSLPGQRALGLRVLDVNNGRPLSPARALLRSILLYGVAAVAMVPYSMVTFERLATLPINSDLAAAGQGLPGSSPLAPWLDVLSVITFIGVAWLGGLLVSVPLGQLRRGIHDRLSSSVIVSIPKPLPPLAWPGYPPGYWAGYDPTPPPGAAPGWTPPGSWTPPQAPTGPASGGITPGLWPPPPVAPGEIVPPGAVTGPGEAGEIGAGELGAEGMRPQTSPSDQGPATNAAGPDQSTPAWLRPDAGARPAAAEAGTMASMGRRIAAYGIDSIILWIPYQALLAIANPDPATAQERAYILVGLAGGVLQMLYFVLGWTLARGSFGQKVIGLSVVDESSGKALSPMDSFLRWAILQGPFALVSIVPLTLWTASIIGASLWSGFLYYTTRADALHQGLHDHFLHTKVVRG
jgi:hypothetical protein